MINLVKFRLETNEKSGCKGSQEKLSLKIEKQFLLDAVLQNRWLQRYHRNGPLAHKSLTSTDTAKRGREGERERRRKKKNFRLWFTKMTTVIRIWTYWPQTRTWALHLRIFLGFLKVFRNENEYSGSKTLLSETCSFFVLHLALEFETSEEERLRIQLQLCTHRACNGNHCALLRITSSPLGSKYSKIFERGIILICSLPRNNLNTQHFKIESRNFLSQFILSCRMD